MCTANLGRHGYLLTSTTDSIISAKDIVPKPFLTNTSVLNPDPFLDVSVIIDQSALVSDSLLPITLPEVPLVVTPVSTFVDPILDVDFALQSRSLQIFVRLTTLSTGGFCCS